MKSQWVNSTVLYTSKLMALTMILSAMTLPVANAQEALSETSTFDDPTAVETLNRGPLHEAYAEPISHDPIPGMIVSKKPPEPITELPPEVRPAEDNVVWISGYWAWDEEREDFLWVSGVWRVPPPGQRWVPGYWTEAENGFQWVAGLWAPVDTQDIEYLPTPPESLEQGPSSPQPSDDYYWVSGCWRYNNGQYAWRSGYWGQYYNGWVWSPAHYNWTPRGAIYVRGYWDYPLSLRGQIFAPVYFHRPVYSQRGYRYSPSVVVNASHLLMHLFVQPRHRHYHWGDYYGDRYRTAGYYPWHQHRGRQGYDSLFSYYQTHYKRSNIDYAKRLSGWNQHYTKHQDRRPSRTFAGQNELAQRARQDANLRYSILGHSAKGLASDRNGASRYRHISDQERNRLANSSGELRSFAKQRSEIEDRARGQQREKNSGNLRDSVASEKSSARWKLPETTRFTSPSDRGQRGSVNANRGTTSRTRDYRPGPTTATRNSASNRDTRTESQSRRPSAGSGSPQGSVRPDASQRRVYKPQSTPQRPSSRSQNSDGNRRPTSSSRSSIDPGSRSRQPAQSSRPSYQPRSSSSSKARSESNYGSSKGRSGSSYSPSKGRSGSSYSPSRSRSSSSQKGGSSSRSRGSSKPRR